MHETPTSEKKKIGCGMCIYYLVVLLLVCLPACLCRERVGINMQDKASYVVFVRHHAFACALSVDMRLIISDILVCFSAVARSSGALTAL